MKASIHHLVHLYHRAGFGINPDLLHSLEGQSLPLVVNHLFADSGSFKGIYELEDERPRKGDVGSLKTILLALKSKEQQELLNQVWIKKMVQSKAVLRERMTLFWHDHFATNVPFALLLQEQNNTLRRNALGNFRQMLHDVAKDPAMIIYLNNQQNRKKAPNENFAREVMELFTLGEGGGYTENDIKEAARCFTGWHVSGRGEFEFNARQYDDGEKTIFGKTGNWTGEQVLDMLLGNPQTATYICSKVYTYFVNPVVHEKRVNALAKEFFESNYDIKHLMELVLTSSWFYDEENIGVKIKSPVDLLTGYQNHGDLDVIQPKSMIRLQKQLGQVLFFPPNVAGWEGNRAWIDSSSLLLRMRLPLVVFDGEDPLSSWGSTKQERREWKKERKIVRFRATGSLKSLANSFAIAKKEKLKDLIDYLLPASKKSIDMQYLQQAWDQEKSFESKVAVVVPMIMALPEYQLC